MKRCALVISCVILFLCVFLSGCEQGENTSVQDEKVKFVGTWQNTTFGLVTTLELFSNGTCTLLSLPGIWDLGEGLFVMEFEDASLSSTYTYKFSHNDQILSLTSKSGLTTVYTKQYSL